MWVGEAADTTHDIIPLHTTLPIVELVRVLCTTAPASGLLFRISGQEAWYYHSGRDHRL